MTLEGNILNEKYPFKLWWSVAASLGGSFQFGEF